MFTKKTVKDIPVKNKTILLRTGYDVPLDKDGNITDDLRIRASLPTIKYLLDQKASKIIIIAHLGRPDGARDRKFSLEPVAKRLQELLTKVPVRFIFDNAGPEVELAVEELPRGGVLLLENLRFSPDEEKNSEDFASEILDSTHPDLFVQDAFPVLHRAHTSTDAITHFLPSVAGLLVEKEISSLTSAVEDPQRPLLLIIGGAKVDDKQPLIDRFASLADQIVVGGKIAADGYETPSEKVYVATDFVSDESGAKLDIGPQSTKKILEAISNAKTVIWNGLLGKTEEKPFDASSLAIAEAIGKRKDITSIIGGGDTAGFVENLTRENPELSYTLVSTGGGASLELLSGLPLPGLDALEDK